MLKPFGLSVVVSDATLSRVTTVESPIHMATLPTLTVQISISAHYHSTKSTERRLRHQAAMKKVEMQQKIFRSQVQAKTDTAQNLMGPSSSPAAASFRDCQIRNGPCRPNSAMKFR